MSLIINGLTKNLPVEVDEHFENLLKGEDISFQLNGSSANADTRLAVASGIFLNLESSLTLVLRQTPSATFLAIVAVPKKPWRLKECFPQMPPAGFDYFSVTDGEVAAVTSGKFYLSQLNAFDGHWLYVYSNSGSRETDSSWAKSLVAPDQVNALETLSSLLDRDQQYLFDGEVDSVQASLADPVWNGGLFCKGQIDLFSPNGADVLGYLDNDFKSMFLVAADAVKRDFYGFVDTSRALSRFAISVPVPGSALSFTLGSREVEIDGEIVLATPLHFSLDGSQIGIHAGLKLGSAGRVDLDFLYMPDSEIFLARAECTISQIPHFDITAFPGMQHFSVTEKIKLLLYFSKVSKSLVKMEFDFEVKDWEIIKDILTLEDVTCSFSLINPLDESRNYLCTVDAVARIGSEGARVFCGGNYPPGSLYFQLDPVTPIYLHKVVQGVIGSGLGFPEGLAISTFEGKYDFSDGSLELDISVSDKAAVWLPQNHPDFALSNLNLSIKGSGTYSCEVSAECKVNINNSTPAPVFNVTADYNNGWSFSANYSGGVSLADLAAEFSLPQPAPLQDIIFKELSIGFDSHSGDKRFFGSTLFNLSSSVAAHLELKIDTAENPAYTGSIEINTDEQNESSKKLRFDVAFDQGNKNTNKKGLLVAAFHEETGENIDLSDLLNLLGVRGPEGLTLSLKDMFFAHTASEKKAGKSKPGFNLIAADIDGGINLSNLPLVGKMLPPDATLSADFRAVYSSERYEDDIDNINALLPAGVAPLVKQDDDKPGKFEFIATLHAGKKTFSLDLDISKEDSNSEQPTAESTESTPAATNDDLPAPNPIKVADSSLKWFNIGKTFGPVAFHKIAVEFKDQNLWFYPDVSIAFAGLEVELVGLSIHSPITRFDPSFDFKGIALSFKNNAVEIGGAFIKNTVTRAGETYDEFNGVAQLKTEAMSISALGSYSYYQGNPSLFVYAYLNKALGGPSFFFVEGLALAFGYNRKLLLPTLDNVGSFPLVRQAMGGEEPDPSKDAVEVLTEQLAALSQYLPPSVGDIFMAIGIKFNSFKLIDSFALLAISFTGNNEVDLIGRSLITVPVKKASEVTTPLAEIKINLLAKYLPNEGTLAVRAQLANNSYIFSKDCHLTGGAAFYSWFKGDHAGDFVMTMGGYHPAFIVPSHYPQVPRLELNWNITGDLSVKGDMYFALCPHAFMAGGHLQATYSSGPFEAWFKAGADFLVTWQPYHYDARIYVNIGASYTFHFFGTHHISVDVGADVHIWGPEFAGTATVDLWITSLTIDFGPQGSAGPIPLKFDEFKSKCLPKTDNIISAAITTGQHGFEGNVPLVNPKELLLSIESAVPLSKISGLGDQSDNSFGVAPMATTMVVSEINIAITKEGDINFDAAQHFVINTRQTNDSKYLHKKFPAALWGTKFNPPLNDERNITALSGIILAAKEPVRYPDPGVDMPALEQLAIDEREDHIAINVNNTLPFNQTIIDKKDMLTSLREALSLPSCPIIDVA